MDRNTIGLLLFGLMVLGGSLAPRADSTDDSASSMDGDGASADKRAESDEIGTPETAPADLIERFLSTLDPKVERPITDRIQFGHVPPKLAKDQNDGDDATPWGELQVTRPAEKPRNEIERLTKLRAMADARGFNVNFLIATVPDPIASHVGWQFDPAVDAIQRGFEDKGFVLDRYFFPWQHYVTPSETDPAGPTLPAYARSPGVMLFRRVVRPFDSVMPPDLTMEHDACQCAPSSRDTTNLHVLLLIGETPTQGTHKVALRRALDLIANWDKAKAKKNAREPLEIRILGPFYSGSSLSLRVALEAWGSAPTSEGAGDRHAFDEVRYRIVSGSAQDIRNKPTLQFKKSAPAGRTQRAGIVKSDFHGTMVPTAVLNRILFDEFFARRDIAIDQIAILVEANTVFGEGASEAVHRKNPKPGEVLTLRYPMQIGRMRSEYERDQVLRPGHLTQGDGSPRTHLELKLDEALTANDLPPAYSNLSAASVETVMSGMLAALARRSPRYVGIIGTDSRDILFLSRLIHQSCPDVQLFTINNDLLYTHPDYHRYTNGMLIFTSYPLFSKSQLWGSHPAARPESRQFSNSWAEGEYNATLALLSPLSPPLDLSCFHGLDYDAPFRQGASTSTKPPVWVVAVSNGAVWPVECYPFDGRKSYKDRIKETLKDERLSILLRDKYECENAECIAAADVHNELTTFDYWNDPSDEGADDDYMLSCKVPARSSRTTKELRLSLGLDGPLGFISLILSWFAILNCAQFLLMTVSCGRRWRSIADLALFSGGNPVRRGSTCLEVRLYHFGYFSALALAEGFVHSPLLTYWCFNITLGEPYWRQHIVLGSAIIAILCLGSVVVALFLWLLVDASKPIRFCTSLWSPFGIVALSTALALWLASWASSLVSSLVGDVIVHWSTTIVAASCGCLALWQGVRLRDGRFRRCASCASWMAIGLVIIVCAIVKACHLQEVKDWDRRDAAEIVVALFAERASNLMSGVSPIPSAIIMVGVLWWLCVCQLRRIRLLAQEDFGCPFPISDELELVGLFERTTDLKRVVRRPRLWWFGWLQVGLIGMILAFLVFSWSRETFENEWFKWLVRIGVFVSFIAIALTLLQVAAVWECLRKLLERLAWHPLRESYERLPGILRREFSAQLFAGVPNEAEGELSLQRWKRLKKDAAAMPGRRSGSPLDTLFLRVQQDRLDARVQKAFAESLSVSSALTEQGMKRADSDLASSSYRRHIERVSRCRARVLAHGLSGWWATRVSRAPAASGGGGGNATARGATVVATPIEAWRMKAEEFVAIEVATVLRFALAHLKNFLQTAVVLVLLLLAMLNSYPFQPDRLLLAFGWLAGFFVTGTAIFIFVRVNRDEVISKISDRTPNEVDWDRHFFFALITYGLIPLLVLLSMQFPQLGTYLSWPLDAISKAIK